MTGVALAARQRVSEPAIVELHKHAYSIFTPDMSIIVSQNTPMD
jgi:hypothetical protein